MKELNPGFPFLDLPTPSQRKLEAKKKWAEAVRFTACNCQNCGGKVLDVVVEFINLAPLREKKYITPEILIADLQTMHADKRKHEIEGARISIPKSNRDSH